MRAIRLFRRAAHVAQFLRQNGYSGYASQIIGISVIPTCAFYRFKTERQTGPEKEKPLPNENPEAGLQ